MTLLADVLKLALAAWKLFRGECPTCGFGIGRQASGDPCDTCDPVDRPRLEMWSKVWRSRRGGK